MLNSKEKQATSYHCARIDLRVELSSLGGLSELEVEGENGLSSTFGRLTITGNQKKGWNLAI